MILETIIKEIERCGKTRYAISQSTDIPESTLCRLVAGKGGLGIKTADKLCKYLGLELRVKKKKRRK